jgi:Lrp/AsnC family transcriptional regulator, leucine-responsive regulatory protein
MTKTLDQIDEKIVMLLRDDARMPLVTLAKRIGLSRSATQERLRRLEANGTIAGYTIRFKAPDDTAVRVWMLIEFEPSILCVDVVPPLMRHPEIRMCHSLSGKPDLIVLAELTSHERIMALRESIAGIPGIATVQTAPMLKAHFDASTGEVSDVVAAAAA